MNGQLRIANNRRTITERSHMITVLVVEDESNIRKLVSVNLTSRGYLVLEATNVPQALNQLRNMTPDLMILDIKLPDMTGWDLLAQIATDPRLTVKFPVLVMTASIMDAQIDHNRHPHIVDVLIKPFSTTRLLAAVDRALRSTVTR
jgi:two-component system, OmpR family, KDP operon response regulator KdpE